jgi:hypothetical protein
MNIQHFEALQKMFLEHVNEDGSSGFYLDMARFTLFFEIIQLYF